MKDAKNTLKALPALCVFAGCSTDSFRLGEGAKLGDCEVRTAPDELRLSGRDGCLAFKPNSGLARIDDRIDLILPSPLRFENGCYVLEKELLERIATPLLFRRPFRAGTVMVDPGHGGDAPGAPGTIVHEKELNLAVALKLRDELEKRGFKVILTRDRDASVSLEERVKLAGDSGADLFVSIHHDASEDRSARGHSVYAPRDCSEFLGESTALAAGIQREILKLPGVVDRGVRFANFFVLRSPMPAALVELGFVSNAEEEKRMNDPIRQEAEAAAIASAIVNYCAGRK